MQGVRWTIIALLGIFLLAIGFSFPLVVFLSGDAPASESFGLKGKVDLILYDNSGEIKEERHLDNMIVASGVAGIANKIAPSLASTVSSSTPYNYIGLGTGNTAVEATQTALIAELPIGASYARVQDADAIYSTASGSSKIILSVTFPPGQGTGTLNESGIFDSSSAGNMLARQTFAEIQKAAGDTLTVTWTITLSPS